MDSDRMAGNWHQLKGKVKEQWGKLTDDDLTQLEGSSEKLAGKLQERYGIRQGRRGKARQGISGAQQLELTEAGAAIRACPDRSRS